MVEDVGTNTENDAMSLKQSSGSPPNSGIVYILSNPAMPNYIKVGCTQGDTQNDVDRRMKELAQPSGVPRAFNCEYAAVVEDYEHVEQTILYAFDNFRVNPRREFLEGIDPIRIRAILKLHELKEVTPGADIVNEQNSGEVERPPKKRDKFRFETVDIPLGSILEWADNPEITCKVVDGGTHVEYKGQRFAISPLAQELKGWKSMPSGTPYWLYEGETLQERRERLEQETDSEDE